MILRAAVAALLLHAAPALAQFQGVADLEMTAHQEGGRMQGKGRLYLSPSAWRMELEMEMGMEMPAPGPPGKGAGAPEAHRVRMVMFGKTAAPGKTWLLNERKKVYAIVEDEPGSGDAGEREGWTVVRVGPDRVAGVSCTNVKAHREGEDETFEACLAKDFISGAWLKSLKAENEWWAAASRRAGVAGFPVRLIARSQDGTEKHRFEFVKVERRKVPASLFEVPGGYRRSDAMSDVLALPPEQQRQLEEAQRRAAESMKNLSPEQQKMMEEMMKEHEGGRK